jgi:hypothetical protein
MEELLVETRLTENELPRKPEYVSAGPCIVAVVKHGDPVKVAEAVTDSKLREFRLED